jgi:ABC-type transporter Mla subunit MlaD
MSRKRLTNSRWSIFIGLAIVVAMCVAAWIFSPKGENQVYVLFTSTSTIHLGNDVGLKLT